MVAMTKQERSQRIYLSHHGLTLDNYNEILEFQRFCCALCVGQPEKLQIDHCHKCCPTGKFGVSTGARSCGRCIRGLVCRGCNLMLGGYENRSGTLRITELDEYLARKPFVFSGPMWDEAPKVRGLYANQRELVGRRPS